MLLIGSACAGHQGFSANLFALPGDLFPRCALGTVVGLGGLAGAVGGMLIAQVCRLDRSRAVGSYTPFFLFAGFAYLLALRGHPPAQCRAMQPVADRSDPA